MNASSLLPCAVFASFAAFVLAAPSVPAQTPAPSPATPPATTPQNPPALPDAPSATAQTVQAATPTGALVLFDTTVGRLTCQFFSNEAPETVANFTGLATGSKSWTDPATQQRMTGKPLYDGTQFHRVIPGFMVQGGDPLANGTGDTGYYLPDEISPALRFDVPGRLAMANSGPNTNSSQFFITLAAQPQLNGHYSIFGQCDPAAVTLANTIANVQRDPMDKPYSPILVNKVTIVPTGKPIPPAPTMPAATLTTPAAPVTGQH